MVVGFFFIRRLRLRFRLRRRQRRIHHMYLSLSVYNVCVWLISFNHFTFMRMYFSSIHESQEQTNNTCTNKMIEHKQAVHDEKRVAKKMELIGKYSYRVR